MYSAQKIVHVVNEHLFDIEKDLHNRDAATVFTKGNCGRMPSFYGETGLSVVPICGDCLRRGMDYTHIMSVVDNPNISMKSTPEQIKNVTEKLQGSVYDITCGSKKETISLSDWGKMFIPNKQDIAFASSRFEAFLAYKRLKENSRMQETRSVLLRKLSHHGMLHMKKNPETGLYTPNEDYRQY